MRPIERHLHAVAAAVLVGLLATGGCGGNVVPRSAAHPATPGPVCSGAPEFRASILPAGWDPTLKPGPGGGGGGAAVGHWVGAQGQFVELLDGQGRYQLTPPLKPLVVLGDDALGGPIHEGFGVEFRACGSPYALNGYGLSAAALYRMAESISVS